MKQSITIPLPLKTNPTWASRVERWNQLDPAAISLVQAIFELSVGLERPDFILFACPEGSLPTDRGFIESQCQSASKFVHTLPSVRLTSLCQLLQWSGLTLCLSHGNLTWDEVQKQAQLLKGLSLSSMWVIFQTLQSGSAQVVLEEIKK